MSLIAELDEKFGVGIDSDDFEKIITVGDLVHEVQKRCC
jgi:acyl carrier protein